MVPRWPLQFTPHGESLKHGSGELSGRLCDKAEIALERAGIPLVALRTTPSALIQRVANEGCEEAVRALHAAFLEPAA